MIPIRRKESRIGTIVSSLKTSKAKETVEIQKLALASWRLYANKVVLLNRRADLEGYDLGGTELIAPGESGPTLKPALQIMGHNQNDTAALVAPNVNLGEGVNKIFAVHAKHKLGRTWAMSAFLETQVLGEAAKGTVDSNMLDLFVGSGSVFAFTAKEIEDLALFTSQDWAVRLNNYLKLRMLGHRYYDGAKLGVATRFVPKSKKQEQSKEITVIALPKTQYGS